MGSLLSGLGFYFAQLVVTPTGQSVLGPRVDWPRVPYAEVRAFFYNANAENFVPIIENGELHKSVIDRNGVLLDVSQVDRLLDAVARPHSDFDVRAACYFPRHAFVFFDEKHQPVAFVEICFSCIAEDTSPKLTHRVGFAELEQLCRDLSLPLFYGRHEGQKYKDAAARLLQSNPNNSSSESSTNASDGR